MTKGKSLLFSAAVLGSTALMGLTAVNATISSVHAADVVDGPASAAGSRSGANINNGKGETLPGWPKNGNLSSVPVGATVSGSAGAVGSSMGAVSFYTDSNSNYLRLDQVPNFDFGSHIFTTNGYSGLNLYASASAVVANNSPEASGVTYGRALGVTDTRGTRDGWKVTVEGTPFSAIASASGQPSVLAGATMTLSASAVVQGDTSTNVGKPVGLTTAVDLNGDTTKAAKVFAASAASATASINGAGTWYQDYAAANTATLAVPTPGVGTYTTTLTWTLTAGF